MSAINPDEIISILKEEIENYDEISQNQEVGTVISVGDGIATVYGIDHAMYGEVVVFEKRTQGNGSGYPYKQHGMHPVW